jgi:hypothetical protein
MEILSSVGIWGTMIYEKWEREAAVWLLESEQRQNLAEREQNISKQSVA